MRIGLASDSDGNLDALGHALATFERVAADRVFFLGGAPADLAAALARRRAGGRGPAPRGDGEFLAAFEAALARHAAPDPLADRLVRVAGRGAPEYGSGAVPRKVMELVEGRICCLVHDKAELTREDIANATVLFHGNAARAALVQIGPRCFVTPGRLRAPGPGGEPPTFGVLDVTGNELVLAVYSADGAGELRRDRATLAAGAKMSVR